MKTVTNLEEVKGFINQNYMSIIIFSSHRCSVCKPLKEKINEILVNYQDIGAGEVYIEDVQTVKGEYSVFTVPIIMLFIDGKEVKRYSAAIDLKEFKRTLNRYYKMIV